MKSLKKVIVVVLALVMLSSMVLTPFAAGEDGHTITINNNESGHTYEAYQIFGGELSSDGKLANIVWGTGIDASKLTDGEKLEGKTAKEWADALSGKGFDSDEAKAFAAAVSKVLSETKVSSTRKADNTGYEIKGLADGYYFVKDSDGSLAGTADAYTRFILEVVGQDVSANPKSSTPSVDKQVFDINDSKANDKGNWDETADHDIGDHVPFRLIGTLPSTYDDYYSYKYVFHDKLSSGLTLDKDSIKVSVWTETTEDGEDVITYNGKKYKAQLIDIEDAYTVGDCDDCSFTVSFANLKDEALKDLGITKDSLIVVDYTALLNENAVVGNNGNPNDVYLEFSNNPNWKGNGEDDDNPDEPDEPTGKTPKDTVVVFTYELDVDKVKDTEDGDALAGAGFTLYKKNKDGEYKAVSFKIVKQDDGTVRAVVASAEEIEAWNNADSEEAKQALGYTIVTELTGEQISKFQFVGLDDGDYKLEETTTPKGYNTIAPIEFTVEATHSEVKTDEGKVTEVKFVVVGDNATITAGDDGTNGKIGVGNTKIVNKAGTTLPETGGIGTTIFYVVGGLMVALAVVLLVTKKRMSNND